MVILRISDLTFLQVRHDLLEEGERLVRFVADEAETFEVRFN